MPTGGPRGSRPTARGKKRGGRSEDPLGRLTRRLDRWVERNPFLSSVASVCVVFLLFSVFWLIFGSHITKGYETYLKQHLDPRVKGIARAVEPHFAALSDLLAEKLGVMETAKRMFTPRLVAVSSKEL